MSIPAEQELHVIEIALSAIEWLAGARIQFPRNLLSCTE